MSEYTVYFPFRFCTAAGSSWTLTRVSWPAGNELRAPTLTTWPIAPESAAGGFRKRSTGYRIPATEIAPTMPISHFRKLDLVITASFLTLPQDTNSTSF